MWLPGAEWAKGRKRAGLSHGRGLTPSREPWANSAEPGSKFPSHEPWHMLRALKECDCPERNEQRVGNGQPWAMAGASHRAAGHEPWAVGQLRRAGVEISEPWAVAYAKGPKRMWLPGAEWAKGGKRAALSHGRGLAPSRRARAVSHDSKAVSRGLFVVSHGT